MPFAHHAKENRFLNLTELLKQEPE